MEGERGAMQKAMNVNGMDEMMYEDRGSGKAVVLLHGFCGSSMYWQYVISELEKNYRVIAPDLRGHGKTSVPEGTYTMESMADDIAQLLQKLNISEAVLFGHSLGGYIALAFAEKYAERLRGLSLVHSTAFPDDEKGKEGREKGMESIRKNGMKPFINGLIPKLFAPEHAASMDDQVKTAKKIGWETNPNGAINTLKGMKERPDRNHVLSASSVPVLLIAGTEDQIIPVEKVFSVEKPHISPLKIEGNGHMSMFEAPNQLLRGMNQFLHKVY
jgi:3-oxoadipate enol-lactonase